MKQNNLLGILFGTLVCTGLSACGGGEKTEPPADHQAPEAHLLKTGSAAAFESSLKSYLLNRPKSATFGESPAIDFSLSGGAAMMPANGTTAAVPAMDNTVDTPAVVSSTNTIEVGVDESDFIKTDGEYLYVVKSQRYPYGSHDIVPMVSIAKHAAVEFIGPAPATPVAPKIEIYQLDPVSAGARLVNTITLTDTQAISGLYLNKGANNKQLVIVGTQYRPSEQYNGSNVTQVFAYDVQQPAQASPTWKFEIEGYNNATRVLNNRIYLVTRKNFQLPGYNYWVSDEKAAAANAEIVANLKIDDIMPKIKLNNADKAIVTASDCAVPTSTDTQSYFDMGLTSIVGIDLVDPTQTQAFCTLENGNDIYVSTNSIYLTKPAYDATQLVGYRSQNVYTIIHKLALTESGIVYRASGSVHGTLGWRNTAFRINEHQDTLRLITTEFRYDLRDSSETHQLFVLQEDSERPNHLKVLSQLPNSERPKPIGKPNERLYGVRFFGDYAYAVTFQKVDPLYVFNLKDPADPFIEGELVIPGFSDYLHPLDENTLLGIGKDAEPQNGTTWFQGIKLGLFDITDKTKPRLLNEIKLGKRGSETPVFSDYKALTILKSPVNNSWRLAMPVTVHDDANTPENMSTYVPFSYCGLALYEIKTNTQTSELEIDSSGTLTLPNTNTSPWSPCGLHQARSAFVDDAIYFTDTENLWSALWTAPNTLIANSPRAIQVKQWSDNKKKWQNNRAIEYTYRYQLKGILHADLLKPLHFTVQDGMLAQAQYTENNENFTSKFPEFFYSVDELFDRIGASLSSNLELDVSYDSELGYPTVVKIDNNGYVAGYDFEATLTNLAITETLAEEGVVVVSGYMDSVTLDQANNVREVFFTVKTDNNQLIDIWNTKRFQSLLAANSLRDHGRVKITGYWRGSAFATGSRFIVLDVARAE